MRRSLRGMCFGVVAFGVAALPTWAPAQTAARVREPLPLDVVVSVRAHNGRSPINFSPDGEWIAHTIATDDNVPRDGVSFRFSATGSSFAEGDSRMEATITNTRTGESIRLGGAASSSWAAVWSPDGERVAFYSDQGGTAGIWVWEVDTRASRRLADVMARPFFGFETVRWSRDGQRVIGKVLPQDVTIAEANTLEGAARPGSAGFPKAGPGEPSVVVRRHDPARKEKPAAEPAGPSGSLDWRAVDLVSIDVRSNEVTRLVQRAPVGWFALSPDERSLAMSVIKGPEPNTQQSLYDIAVVDLTTGVQRTIASDIRLGYGIEWSWSPDSGTVAFFESGQRGEGRIVLVNAADGSRRRLDSSDLPKFATGEGEVAPLWTPDAAQIYAVGDENLWRVDVASGRGTALGEVPDWETRAIVTTFGRNTIWTSDGGRLAWVIAREGEGGRAGIHSIDLLDGQARAALQEPKTYSRIFDLAGNDATGELAFVSTGQQQLQDIWLMSTRDRRVRRATNINTALDRYELGTARLIEWTTDDGQALRGALLVPPGYREGTRLPLVVSVYGGAMGSGSVNSFAGRGGSLPNFNMHVLTTRGYAVLFPDAPLRAGKTMTDIVRVVMPGVDAAISLGYADPDRLAVMGQSYGSFNTLSIITQTPRFKAAVITAAVLHPDLAADYLGSIGYYEQGQGNMGGSLWEQRARYLENSPLFLFDRIETPLLIGQGERDGNLVPANAIFNALERLDKPVEFRLYQAEGHVITQKPNVRDFWRRRLDFFSEHLDLRVDERGAVVFENGRARSRK